MFLFWSLRFLLFLLVVGEFGLIFVCDGMVGWYKVLSWFICCKIGCIEVLVIIFWYGVVILFLFGFGY